MVKQISLAGKRLVYDTYGAGKPVLLVHGFGETRQVWKNQVEHLAKKFLLLVPDLPGSGDSEIQEDMSMEGLAETLLHVLRAENIDQFTLLGHSMGGYIALAFAEKYPEEVYAFGLIHSSAFPDSAEKIETREKGITFIRKNGAARFLENTSPKLFSPATHEKNPGLIDGFIQSLSNFSADALVLYYQAMIRRPDRTHVLKDLKVPVLFIFGEADTAIPLDDGLKLCHLPEKAYIEILSLSGHMGMLEEPENMNRQLEIFLTET
jgi:pimeloyl-ACP methyl ester carboxylesterase